MMILKNYKILSTMLSKVFLKMINIEEIITKKLKEVDVVIGGSRDWA